MKYLYYSLHCRFDGILTALSIYIVILKILQQKILISINVQGFPVCSDGELNFHLQQQTKFNEHKT